MRRDWQLLILADNRFAPLSATLTRVLPDYTPTH